jgi:trimeric autotransporter adhesin
MRVRMFFRRTSTRSTSPKGDIAKLDAIGHFSDGSTFDISAEVTWTSNSLSKATVDSVGHVTAVATGTATITARKGASISDTIPVNVSDAEVRSVEVQPAQWSLTVGGPLISLHAIGHFSDGSESDLTLSPETTWASSAPGVANVNNTSTKGLVTAVSPGVATISATVTATVVTPDGTPTQVEVFGTASIEVQS